MDKKDQPQDIPRSNNPNVFYDHKGNAGRLVGDRRKVIESKLPEKPNAEMTYQQKYEFSEIELKKAYKDIEIWKRQNDTLRKLLDKADPQPPFKADFEGMFNHEENQLREEQPEALTPDLTKITRFEVINHVENNNRYGRAFTDYDVKNIDIEYQDKGRTLKVFIFNKQKESKPEELTNK